jgi:probable rRNA maturation factor
MTDVQLTVDVQYAVSADGIPGVASIRQWVMQALPDEQSAAELTVRIVDEAEMTALNMHYRGKDGPTNVLSFPYEAIAGIETGLLGDVVICAPVVVTEAVSQDKPLQAHWAHLVIHGVLHLLGYDHRQQNDALRMETTETELLAGLGYQNPYGA